MPLHYFGQSEGISNFLLTRAQKKTARITAVFF